MKSVLISVLMFAALQAVAAAQVSPDRVPGTVFKDCVDCPELVVIPAGRFMMGVAPGEEEREALSEQFRNRSQPRHEVDV